MGQGNDEREQTLNQILVELDGFGAESGVVVMAATNRPDILDNALLRPGRFDRQVVDVPDLHGRAQILELHASASPVSPSADLMRIAHQTPGFTGADLANIINEAALLTVRANKQLIEQDELEEAIDRVISGARTQKPPPLARRAVANRGPRVWTRNRRTRDRQHGGPAEDHAWAVGGYAGTLDAAEQGTTEPLASRSSSLRTASIWRYDSTASAQAPGLTAATPSLTANPARSRSPSSQAQCVGCSAQGCPMPSPTST
jgi:hypothetical protein